MLFLFPELELFKRGAERKKALKHAREGTWLNLWYMTSIVLLVLAVIRAKFAVRSYLDVPDLLETAIVVGTSGSWVAWAPLLFSRKTIQRRLRERLNELGIGMCMSCGYRILPEQTRCPECGTQCKKDALGEGEEEVSG